jgi:hypothetical protein
MQFFLLLMFNIFMGAMIYLVITLKLEKSVDDYRKKKFREEMDAVITEFNSTAERNISLLENRIEIIRNLIEKSDTVHHVDIIVEDEKISNKIDTEKKEKEPIKAVESDSINAEKDEPSILKETSAAKKSLLLLKKKVIDKFTSGTEEFQIPENSRKEDEKTGENPDILEKKTGNSIDFTIEKDLNKELKALTEKSEQKEEEPSEEFVSGSHAKENAEVSQTRDELINEIIAENNDAYSRVSELKKIGCSTEEISYHAQIPEGEVHLVLNLIQS